MANALRKTKAALSLLSHGRIAALAEEVKRELGSVETSYAFRRDLTIPFETRPTSVPIILRPFERGDISLLTLDSMGRDTTKLMERLSRIDAIGAGIPSAVYVAVTRDDSPCFLQWLVAPEANDRLNTYYKGYFPPLARDEVLLEGAFVPERHRGKGIMTSAMSKVADEGASMGARWAITYVDVSNLPSIRGCLACGFHPFLTRKAEWRAFKRRLFFAPLDGDECGRLETSWRKPGQGRR
jgi:hypothetical protein